MWIDIEAEAKMIADGIAHFGVPSAARKTLAQLIITLAKKYAEEELEKDHQEF